MAGEKNTKYKPEYDELMTVDEVKLIGSKRKGVSCVYVFYDGATPVYVGRTVNTKRRFEPYCAGACHNAKLRGFITSNRNNKIVKLIQCDDIKNKERELIQEYKESLFNISMGGNIDWKSQARVTKPWIAGTGIKSPVQLALMAIKDKSKAFTIKQYIKGLTDKDRCLLEVDVAMQMKLNQSVRKWLDIVTPKLIKTLEVN